MVPSEALHRLLALSLKMASNVRFRQSRKLNLILITILISANASLATDDGEKGIDSGLGNDVTTRNSDKSAEIKGKMDVDDARAIALAVTGPKDANDERLAGNEQGMDVEDAEASGTAVVPDNNEKLVEGCTVASAGTSSKAVDMPPPAWLFNILPYLRDVSDVKDWQDLVVALVEFEKVNPPQGVSPFVTECFSVLFKPYCDLEIGNPPSSS